MKTEANKEITEILEDISTFAGMSRLMQHIASFEQEQAALGADLNPPIQAKLLEARDHLEAAALAYKAASILGEEGVFHA